ncbi:amino acid racemase [bacterium]|nr:amino acid racemase [bacterium]MCI0603646.1 amino acid racemase [bacterium]
MKHIGIVACSAEGAALCYRTICVEGEAILGTHRHPEVSMHTYSLGDYMEPIYKDDWQGVADLMISSGKKLASIGADFLICPDNTLHQAFELVQKETPLPWLHIAEEVGREANRGGLRKLGITGTKYLMEGTVYPSRLKNFGIESIIPTTEDRIKINNVIFEELVKSKFLESSRNYFSGVIQQLKKDGCDGVVLGCTEIPLLITQEDSELPVLDSTRLLARAALKKAVL